MSQVLFMFIMTPGTGSYINAIANAVQCFDIDEIVFINIINSNSGDQINFDKFVKVVLPTTIEYLLQGTYRDIRPDGKWTDTPAPKAANFEVYRKVKEIIEGSYDIKAVNYERLIPSIEEIKDRYKRKDGIVLDITGVSKRVAIDILTACLAIEISSVTLFELKIPPKGEATLYHNLSRSEFEHRTLPQWGPLIGNIEFFAARQNRQKLRVVMISIFMSILFVIAQQLSQTAFGSGSGVSWLLVAAIAVIGIVGGISPIIDAWGGLKSFKKNNEYLRHDSKRA